MIFSFRPLMVNCHFLQGTQHWNQAIQLGVPKIQCRCVENGNEKARTAEGTRFIVSSARKHCRGLPLPLRTSIAQTSSTNSAPNLCVRRRASCAAVTRSSTGMAPILGFSRRGARVEGTIRRCFQHPHPSHDRSCSANFGRDKSRCGQRSRR